VAAKGGAGCSDHGCGRNGFLRPEGLSRRQYLHREKRPPGPRGAAWRPPDDEDGLVAAYRDNLRQRKGELERAKVKAEQKHYPGAAEIAKGLQAIDRQLAIRDPLEFLNAMLSSRDVTPGDPEARKSGSPATDAAAAAVRSMESQVLDASRNGAIEGVILRYGLFYGPQVPSTLNTIDRVRRHRLPIVRDDEGQLPVINVEDAAAATVLALDLAPAGAVYDIVDDRPVSFSEIVETVAEFTESSAPWRVPAWIPRLLSPYMARLISLRMPLSNAKAKAELGWRPRYPTIREGLAPLARRAA